MPAHLRLARPRAGIKPAPTDPICNYLAEGGHSPFYLADAKFSPAMPIDNFQPLFQVHAAIIVVTAEAGRKAFFKDGVGIHQADRPPREVMSRPAVAVDPIDHESVIIAGDPVPNPFVFQGQIRA